MLCIKTSFPSQASSEPPTATDGRCTAGSPVSGFNCFGISIYKDNVMDCPSNEGTLLLCFIYAHPHKETENDIIAHASCPLK